MYFYHSGLEQLALVLKNRVALKFFAVWNMLFTFWNFEQLALALKNRGFPEFSVPNIYYYSGILNNLRLLWKTEGVLNSLYWMYFFYSGFLSNLGLPWKTAALEFFTVLKYILLFRVFEQLAVALKFFKTWGAAAPDPLPRTPMYEMIWFCEINLPDSASTVLVRLVAYRARFFFAEC